MVKLGLDAYLLLVRITFACKEEVKPVLRVLKVLVVHLISIN